MFFYKKKLFIVLSALIALTAISSCSKIDEFGDLNVNPNGAQSPSPAGLLTSVLSGMGNYVWDGGGVSTVSGLYCQYFSETQYTEASRYAKPTTNWDGYYAGPLKRLQTIIDFNNDPSNLVPNPNEIAIARILKSYIFYFLTNTWGDIPYKGIFNVEENGVVAYTSQPEIYDSLFSELSSAINEFDESKPMAGGDILFTPSSIGAQIGNWQKFANSVRVLIALNISKVDATKGASEFKAALSAPGGVFEEGQSAVLNYPDANFPNPFYNYYTVVQRDDYAVSSTIVNYLQPPSVGYVIDDRLFSYTTNFTSSLTVTGFPYGLERGQAVNFQNQGVQWGRVVGTSTVLYADGTNYRLVTSPVTVLGSAEIYLARAEAAYLGWTNEDYESMYYTGIAESWKQWDVFSGILQPAFGGGFYDEDYPAYIADPSVELDGTTADYGKIATQEWVTHYPAGWKGWTDWRRTGFPALSPAPGTPKIPLRYPYGPNEYNLNPVNANAGAANYDNDSQFSALWWDK